MNFPDLSSLLRTGTATVLAAGGLALAAAPTAHAANYWSVGFGFHGANSNDGWSATSNDGGGGYISASMSGYEADGIWNVNGGRSVFSQDNHTTFHFAAPNGMSIFEAGWAQEARGLAGGDWTILVQNQFNLMTANVPASDGYIGHTEPASGPSVDMILSCHGRCVANTNALFKITKTAIGLVDKWSPDVGPLTGALQNDEETVTGTAPLMFRATDIGSGLRYVHIYSDGRETVKALVPGNDGHCSTNWSDDGRPMYDRSVPCVPAATISTALDTTQLEDGNHTILVTLDDAAGNSVPVYGPKSKRVANHPPVNLTIPRIDKTEASFDAYAAPRVGQPVTFSSAGSWSGPNLVLSHVWVRCSAKSTDCNPIPGADELTYIPTVADVGYTLRLRSEASNVAGNARVESVPSGEVIAPKSVGELVDKPVNGTNGSNGTNGNNGTNGANPALPSLPVLNITSNEAHTLIGRVVGQERGVACPGDRATLRFEHVSGGRVHLRHGRASTAQLELTCTTTGKAIADAKLEIATKTGTRPTVASDVTTDGAGHATIRLGAGASRGIAVGYRMYADDAVARAMTTLKVVVDARISITANHQHLHNGQAVTLRGALSGGLVPKRGVTLSVQWKDGKRWRPFAQIKTDKNGKYAYAYRFTRSNRTVAYHLRVQIAGGQVDYPFAAVASKPVKVTVGR